MSTGRRRTMQEICWLRKAESVRRRLNKTLVSLGIDGEYLDRQYTESLGKRFWERAVQCDYHQPESLDSLLNNLMQAHPLDSKLIWFHRETADAGALLSHFEHVPAIAATCNSKVFGPDLLITGNELEFGVCYEQGEHEKHLRYW